MKTLPTPKELIQKLSLNENQRLFVKDSRNTIQNIIEGKDSRLLVIVGPCSIHDTHGALEFAKKLQKLQEACKNSFFFVMRTYAEKARTSYGWKGILYDPFLNGSNQIDSGLSVVREFLLSLAELKVPAACEFLDPYLHSYIDDLISWGCIGARTSASQIHRQLASGLQMPVGFKNNPEGSIEPAINGIYSSNKPHTFLSVNDEGQLTIKETLGNPYSHLVLRGGEKEPNFHPKAVYSSVMCLNRMGLNPSIIIDCSHDNSEKKHELQPLAFEKVIQQVIDGNTSIKGLMLESYLFSGNQPVTNELKYGVSITDSCLSWEDTQNLLLKTQDLLQGHLQEEVCVYV